MTERPTRQVSRWRTATTYLVTRTRPISIVRAPDGSGASVVIGDETLRLNAREVRDLTAALVAYTQGAEEPTDQG